MIQHFEPLPSHTTSFEVVRLGNVTLRPFSGTEQFVICAGFASSVADSLLLGQLSLVQALVNENPKLVDEADAVGRLPSWHHLF